VAQQEEACATAVKQDDRTQQTGRADPEVFRVCEDVYGIVEKMLSANKAIVPFSRHPRFDFEEVPFVLCLLGAPMDQGDSQDYSSVDL